MVFGKRWLFLIGNGAEIRPLEKGRKSPGVRSDVSGETVNTGSSEPSMLVDAIITKIAFAGSFVSVLIDI